MSVLVGMVLAGLHRGRGRRAGRAPGAAARRHLPVARDVRVRAVLRQRHGEVHVGERRQRHHAAEDAAPAPRARSTSPTRSRSSCCASSSSRSSGCWSCGCAAERPAASSTRCAAARSRPRRSASTRLGGASPRSRSSAGPRRRRRRPARDARAVGELQHLLRRAARLGVGRRRRVARVAHGRRRDPGRSRLHLLPAGRPRGLDPVAVQPRARVRWCS